MRKLKLQCMFEMDFMKGENVLKDTLSISESKVIDDE